MVARAPVAGGVQRADADPLVEAAGGEHIVELVSAKRFRSVVSPALDRPEFAANPDRVRRRKELRALLEPIFRERPVKDREDGLGEVGVPVGRVRSVAGILENPQLQARGMLLERDHPAFRRAPGEAADPGSDRLRLVGNRVQFDGEPRAAALPPPLQGEHTDAVLTDIAGYTEAEVGCLRDSGALGGP